MAAVTASNIEKDSSGNETVVTADLTSVDNNDTWLVPHLTNISWFSVTCTTDDDISGTVSGNTITFKTGGTAIAGACRVWGR